MLRPALWTSALASFLLVGCGGDGFGSGPPGEQCICACDGSDDEGDYLRAPFGGEATDGDASMVLSIGGKNGCSNRPTNHFELVLSASGFVLLPVDEIPVYAPAFEETTEDTFAWASHDLEVTIVQGEDTAEMRLTFTGIYTAELLCEGEGESITCQEIATT